MKTLHTLSLLITALFFSSITYGQNKEDAKNLVTQGVALHDAGKYAEAIQKYQDAIKIDPENSTAFYELSYTLFSSGKGKEALPYLEKVIKLDPGAGGAYDMLGSVYDDDKQPEKAIDYFLKGIKDDPNYQRLYYNIAITYYRQGKYADAEANAINAIKLQPKHASSHRIYAMITNKQNKLGCSLLGWCSFLLVEPQTKRSVEAMAYVKAIINNGIKKNAEKSVTITMQENNMNPANLMMPMAVINATSGKTNLSSVDSLTLQLTSLFEVAHTITGDKDQPFIAKYFSDYFVALGKSGNMPAFARYMSLSVYTDENKKWFKDHDKELSALDTWVSSTKREF
jgi:tetratricopeptide (TPR) repeat protein